VIHSAENSREDVSRMIRPILLVAKTTKKTR
jgi:hypothetical protein